MTLEQVWTIMSRRVACGPPETAL